VAAEIVLGYASSVHVRDVVYTPAADLVALARATAEGAPEMAFTPAYVAEAADDDADVRDADLRDGEVDVRDGDADEEHAVGGRRCGGAPDVDGDERGDTGDEADHRGGGADDDDDCGEDEDHRGSGADDDDDECGEEMDDTERDELFEGDDVAAADGAQAPPPRRRGRGASKDVALAADGCGGRVCTSGVYYLDADGCSVAVSKALHYGWRDRRLKRFNAQEFFARFEIKRMSKKELAEAAATRAAREEADGEAADAVAAPMEVDDDAAADSAATGDAASTARGRRACDSEAPGPLRRSLRVRLSRSLSFRL
jgi:hypothetical protein